VKSEVEAHFHTEKGEFWLPGLSFARRKD